LALRIANGPQTERSARVARLSVPVEARHAGAQSGIPGLPRGKQLAPAQPFQSRHRSASNPLSSRSILAKNSWFENRPANSIAGCPLTWCLRVRSVSSPALNLTPLRTLITEMAVGEEACRAAITVIEKVVDRMATTAVPLRTWQGRSGADPAEARRYLRARAPTPSFGIPMPAGFRPKHRIE